jgi:hypothetical protein
MCTVKWSQEVFDLLNISSVHMILCFSERYLVQSSGSDQLSFRDYWVYELCPLSGVLKEYISETSYVLVIRWCGREPPAQLDLLKSADISHWSSDEDAVIKIAFCDRPNWVTEISAFWLIPSFHLGMETSSFWKIYSLRILHDRQNPETQ